MSQVFAVVVAGRVLDRLETEHEAQAYAREWSAVMGQPASVRCESSTRAA